jgi:hypothetical protein
MARHPARRQRPATPPPAPPSPAATVIAAAMARHVQRDATDVETGLGLQAALAARRAAGLAVPTGTAAAPPAAAKVA